MGTMIERWTTAGRASRAYGSLVRAIERYATHGEIEPAEGSFLREAADARLFGDGEADGWSPVVDVVLDRVRQRGVVSEAELSAVRDGIASLARLHARRPRPATAPPAPAVAS